jgi:hypothetical protein
MYRVVVGVGVYMYFQVLKIELANNMESTHDVANGVVDSSTTKVKKTHVLPKSPLSLLLKFCQR